MASEQIHSLVESGSSDDSDSISEEWAAGPQGHLGNASLATVQAIAAAPFPRLPGTGDGAPPLHRLSFVPPSNPDLILRSEDGEEFLVRKAYLEMSSGVFRDMLQLNADSVDLEGGAGSRKRKRGGLQTPLAVKRAAAATKRDVKKEGSRDVDSDDEAATSGGDSAGGRARTTSSSPDPVTDSDLPVVDVLDPAKDINLFLIAVHHQFSLNESLAIEEVELLLRLADKYEASAVTHLAFFHLQPLVPRQFNRALALGTLYKHFNTVRLAIKYQRSSPVKMKGIPQDLFVQLSSPQIYALLQVEASTSQANYRSPDWPKLAKDLGIELPQPH